METKTYELQYQKDARGLSLEIFKSQVKDFDVKYIYLITSSPNTIRGNHYHTYKNELMCITQGKARFTMLNRATGHKEEFEVSEEKPMIIRILPNTIHTIKNIGEKDLQIIELATKVFDPNNADTFKEVIA